MPVSIRKTAHGYRVSTPNAVHAKHTTKAKAKSQERLLNAVDHGWKPTHESVSATVDSLLEHGPVDRDDVEPLRQWDNPKNPNQAHESREVQIAWELLQLSANLPEASRYKLRTLGKELLTMHGVS